MRTKLFLFVFCLIHVNDSRLANLMNTSLHDCIRCLCHAVSGCYELKKCAQYSMTFDYWTRAGRPSLYPLDGKNERFDYQDCMENDNCILHTIRNYTLLSGEMDCNCDNLFTCEDKLAIHYDKCENPQAINEIDKKRQLFKECSGVSMSFPTVSCTPELLIS